MKVTTETSVKTLGDCAYKAIEKFFLKTIKWEKAVKKDEDPEALHQMRIGMRRLRTAVSRFSVAVSLPKSANDKSIGKIAKTLGNLRDLDVLKADLETNYQSQLLEKEQISLNTAFSTLCKQREIALDDVLKTLKSNAYKSFKSSIEEWLEKPNYKPLAFLPIQQVSADLLLPEISYLLLHPAWLVGTQIVNDQITISNDLTSQKLEEYLNNEGENLHDLRKQAKRVRYQMDLFTQLYGEDFSAHIMEVKSIQEILGNLQDSIVLYEWLANIFKSETQAKFKGLTNLLAENRWQIWQQWQPIQKKYLKTETKQRFHLIILNPHVED
ncbi:MAG TPA: CHAD domain-containing protein [Nostocaceae cyanobacterium]|nr:CHAD domain-containing protein [Nostocaceae cyanobacterium]